MAPKPLMVQQCAKDGLFPLDGMKESLQRIAAICWRGQFPRYS